MLRENEYAVVVLICAALCSIAKGTNEFESQLRSQQTEEIERLTTELNFIEKRLVFQNSNEETDGRNRRIARKP